MSPRCVSAILIVAASCVGAVAATETRTSAAQRLAHEAEASRTAGDSATCIAKLQAAVERQPGWPELWLKLAASQAAGGRPAGAIGALDRLAALGVYQPAETDNAFAPLRASPGFQSVLARLRSNLQPTGQGEIAFELPGARGLIEGIAWRAATDAFYFGDVHERCVWLRTSNGAVSRFTKPDDRLLGVFRIVVDERRTTLWAATSAPPQISGYSNALKGAAGIAECDLNTGELRRVLRVPKDGKDHLIGDLMLAPDGTVYATDSLAPVIWMLPPGGTELTAFLWDDTLASLQGIACSPDGRGLFVTDYAQGALYVDLVTRGIRLLEPPPNTTVLGCDTLVVAPDGALIAVQNGTQPQRVLRLEVDEAKAAIRRVEVLMAAHPAMIDATLGTIVGDTFVFIANGGWNRFEPDMTATRLVSVPIIRIPLKRATR